MSDIIEIITPKPKDLGGFTVRRALPQAGRRNVGPFVFFDEIGPADFAPGDGVNVRAHPHIGLATITYLFDGEMTHRDSVGAVQSIRPGDVNLMNAGRGVTHSERTGAEARANGHRLHGLQIWVALPKAHEETDPTFTHTPAAAVPYVETGGATATIVVGAAHGAQSPVHCHADVLYVVYDASDADAPVTITLPDNVEERALYAISGAITLNDTDVPTSSLAVLGADSVQLTLAPGARAALIGGAALDAPRYLSWNFVSSSRERLAQAERDWTQSSQSGWAEGPFCAPVDDGNEYIPLP